jgi:hypothetical protein
MRKPSMTNGRLLRRTSCGRSKRRDGSMKALDIMRKFDVAEQTVYKWTKKARLVRPHA